MQAPIILAFGIAFVACFLVSRVLFWLLRRWDGEINKVVLVHFASLLILTLAGGLAMSPDGRIQWATALLILPPQFVWLIVDLIRGVGYVEPDET
jgi:hypothetical protein